MAKARSSCIVMLILFLIVLAMIIYLVLEGPEIKNGVRDPSENPSPPPQSSEMPPIRVAFSCPASC